VLSEQIIDFKSGEALEDFEARVHVAEHKLLVNTLKILLEEKVK